ncbi:MAG: hypothetical protein L6R48_25395, partial [Planctomycetes bacterium]|nr:hypothetical protein [Planctomycetota bacterium]
MRLSARFPALALLHSAAPPPRCACGSAPQSSLRLLATLGLFAAGVLPAAEPAALAGPYEDPRQAEIPFGRHSYHLAPWRGYMDTWPVAQVLECMAANAGRSQHPEAVVQVLADHGVRSLRLELPWSGLAWGNDGFNEPERPGRWLRACRAHGLRPLVLLNSHHGVPGPTRFRDLRLAAPAAKGARQVRLVDDGWIVPGRTGFTNLGKSYRAIYPLITALAADGSAELSAPLPEDLPAGPVRLSQTRFRPFSGAVNPDGSPNPDSRETVAGWLQYAATAMAFTREQLGGDAFDLEVWNEYSFGSSFLDVNRYHDPKLEFRQPIAYERDGRTVKGVESILAMTVDLAAARFPGVRVTSGFASQRPWDNGGGAWPGQFAISKHYYSNQRVVELSPDNPLFGNRDGPLGADGSPLGTPDRRSATSIVPGSAFIPRERLGMPEFPFYAYKTEDIVRDLQPWPRAREPGYIGVHHRFTHPGDGRPPVLWQTEYNFAHDQFIPWMAGQAQVAKDDPALIALCHAMRAKAMVRALLFQAHKGVYRVSFFAPDHGPDLEMLPAAFFAQVKADGGRLSDAARALAGPQLPAVKRTLDWLRSRGRALDACRKLAVEAVVEHDPRLVWKGGGTPATPDRFHRDDLAVLPFQLDERRFAIAVYVVTHDLARSWDEGRGLLDPARYDMPDQTFELAFANLRGAGARVSLYDPLRDRAAPAELLAGDERGARIRLAVSDAPRLLLVEEDRPGPLLVAPAVDRRGAGPQVRFQAAVAGTATITWGPLPGRRALAPGAGGSATCAVAAGQAGELALPGAGGDQAVRVELAAAGLVHRWPMWDLDVAGQLAFAPGAPRPSASAA